MGGPPEDIYATVELFGCDGVDGPLRLNNFPYPVNLAGGRLLPDGSGVLVCGGFDADLEDRTTNCWEWRPDVDEWTPAPDLNEQRFQHLIALSADLDDDTSDERVC